MAVVSFAAIGDTPRGAIDNVEFNRNFQAIQAVQQWVAGR
jgi:hypothetical protein